MPSKTQLRAQYRKLRGAVLERKKRVSPGLVHIRDHDGGWLVFVGMGWERVAELPDYVDPDSTSYFPEWLGRMVRPAGKEAQRRAEAASEQAAAEWLDHGDAHRPDTDGYERTDPLDWKPDPEPTLPTAREFIALDPAARRVLPREYLLPMAQECFRTYKRSADIEQAIRQLCDREFDDHYQTMDEFIAIRARSHRDPYVRMEANRLLAAREEAAIEEA